MLRPGCLAVALLAAAALPLSSAADTLAEGRQLFLVYCASCHGPYGEGSRGPTLARPVLPRAPTEEALIKLIEKGIPGTEMPRFQLAPGEPEKIATWVKHLGTLPPERLSGDPG